MPENTLLPLIFPLSLPAAHPDHPAAPRRCLRSGTHPETPTRSASVWREAAAGSSPTRPRGVHRGCGFPAATHLEISVRLRGEPVSVRSDVNLEQRRAE
jgi:hypothetical protein